MVDAVRQQRSLLVTSLTPVTEPGAAPNQVIARVEGIQPAPEAIPCEPTLEDGYFTIIGGTDQDEDHRQRLVNALSRRQKLW